MKICNVPVLSEKSQQLCVVSQGSTSVILPASRDTQIHRQLLVQPFQDIYTLGICREMLDERSDIDYFMRC